METFNRMLDNKRNSRLLDIPFHFIVIRYQIEGNFVLINFQKIKFITERPTIKINYINHFSTDI